MQENWSSPNSTTPLNAGMVISNRYRLQKPLGKGSFGQVFLAEDLKFKPPRLVAIKFLHTDLLVDPLVRQELEKEAGMLAHLNHPNILRVIDFEINENAAYVITDYADKGSLSTLLKSGPGGLPIQLPLSQVDFYLGHLSDALDYAHSEGLMHRDIKPLNVLLNSRGQPLIADFGMATPLANSASSIMIDVSISGTPHYMAPEQWLGQAGKSSDIYSLAVMTYQMITGLPPFLGNPQALGYQHINAPVPPLSTRAPDLKYPPALDTVIAGGMAKDPHQRTRPAMEFYRRFHAAIYSPTARGSTGGTYDQSSLTFELPKAPLPPLQPQVAPAPAVPDQPQPVQQPIIEAAKSGQIPSQPQIEATKSDAQTKFAAQAEEMSSESSWGENSQNEMGQSQFSVTMPFHPKLEPRFIPPKPKPVSTVEETAATSKGGSNIFLLAGLGAVALLIILVGVFAVLNLTRPGTGGTVESNGAQATARFQNPFANQPTTAARSNTATTQVATTNAAVNQSSDNIPGVETFSGLAVDHTTGKVNYPQNPPVGGPHNPILQNCGIYDQPVFNENAVHSMEHGAVWISYQPDLAQDLVEQLRALVRGKGYIILAPYPGLPSPVIATAWGVQLKLTSPSDAPRLAQFIAKYRVGAQAPEPGYECSGGVGTPIAQ